jgi:mono/diheme cytochrome c family protein
MNACRFLKYSGVLTVLVMAAAFLAACGGGEEAPIADYSELAEGQELFKRTCATCHGPSGEGIAALGKNLNANEFVKENSDAELIEFMKLGRPATHPDNTRGVDMPPKGGNPMLTDQDLAKIVTYLRSLQ